MFALHKIRKLFINYYNNNVFTQKILTDPDKNIELYVRVTKIGKDDRKIPANTNIYYLNKLEYLRHTKSEENKVSKIRIEYVESSTIKLLKYGEKIILYFVYPFNVSDFFTDIKFISVPELVYIDLEDYGCKSVEEFCRFAHLDFSTIEPYVTKKIIQFISEKSSIEDYILYKP